MTTKSGNGDSLVWYLMTFAMGILVIGGGAWANSMNQKVEKIAGLEVNIQYIQNDLASIKNLIIKAIKEQ